MATFEKTSTHKPRSSCSFARYLGPFPSPPSSRANTLQIIESAPNADPSSLCLSNQPRGGATNVNSLLGRTLKDLGLR